MSPFYEILLFTSFILGIYLSAVLFVTKRYNKLLNRLLGAVTLSISVFYLVFYLIIKKWIVDVPFFARSFTPLAYLTPACSYLYVRCFIRDEYQLRKKDLLHFLPFLLHLILLLPYLFSSITIKRQLATALTVNIDHFQDYNTSFIPERYHLLFRLILSVVYISLIWKMMLSKDYRSFVQKNDQLYPYAINWIRFFAVFISLMALMAGILKWQIFADGNTLALNGDEPVSVILLSFYIVLLIYGLSNPVILYGLPHFVKPEPAVAPSAEIYHSGNTGAVLLADSYSSATLPKAPFESDMIEEYEQMLRKYVADHAPYCDPDFNIASLSKGMNVPQHHLAYIFRYQIQQSFVDYRTHLRVEHVKRALHEGKDKELTLEAIGESAGFASRSTFFLAFKKLTGKNPSQYVEAIRTGG